MGVVDQTVEDGVGDGGVADLLVPVIHRELTGDDGGGMTVLRHHSSMHSYARRSCSHSRYSSK